MPDGRAIFDPSLPVLEILSRGVLTYIGLLFMLRIVGQREVGAIGLHDLLVIVLIAEAAAQALGQYQAIPDGLMIVATLHGVDDISQVKRAYVEPNGMISVLRKDGGEVEAPEPLSAV
jgi:uncharacterized membrane protein YcaP (DUF421 family)